MTDEKKPHAAKLSGPHFKNMAYTCVCSQDADHAMGPLSKEQMEGYAGSLGCEMINMEGVPWAFRNGPEEAWICGHPRAQIWIAELPPKWSETAEDVRRASDALASFTRDAYRVQIAQRDEDLKTIIRRAMKLVEENPRHEPMRAEISRPAVERLLAADLERTGLGAGEREDLAHELFDAGWRPTIDRLVR